MIIKPKEWKEPESQNQCREESIPRLLVKVRNKFPLCLSHFIYYYYYNSLLCLSISPTGFGSFSYLSPYNTFLTKLVIFFFSFKWPFWRLKMIISQPWPTWSYRALTFTFLRYSPPYLSPLAYSSQVTAGLLLFLELANPMLTCTFIHVISSAWNSSPTSLNG